MRVVDSGVRKEPFCRSPMRKGNVEGKGRPSSAVSCTKTAVPIDMPFGKWTWVGHGTMT